MITFKCSRCKKESKNFGTLKVVNYFINQMELVSKEYEFCRKCTEELYKNIITHLDSMEDK